MSRTGARSSSISGDSGLQGIGRWGMVKVESRYERIYAIIRRIPAGRVATYGQIAELAGLPGHARQVGYALYALPEQSLVPWHRVVNAQGRLSLGRVIPEGDVEQRIRLEIEGVEFDADGRIALGRFQWRPRFARLPAPKSS